MCPQLAMLFHCLHDKTLRRFTKNYLAWMRKYKGLFNISIPQSPPYKTNVMISISQRCQEIKNRYLGQCQAHKYCARGCQPQWETPTSHDHLVLSGIWFSNIETWRLVYRSLHIFHASPCGMYKYRNHWLLKSTGWTIAVQAHPPSTSGDEGEAARLPSHKQVIPPWAVSKAFFAVQFSAMRGAV